MKKISRIIYNGELFNNIKCYVQWKIFFIGNKCICVICVHHQVESNNWVFMKTLLPSLIPREYLLSHWIATGSFEDKVNTRWANSSEPFYDPYDSWPLPQFYKLLFAVCSQLYYWFLSFPLICVCVSMYLCKRIGRVYVRDIQFYSLFSLLYI